jgi:hypothetical protein
VPALPPSGRTRAPGEINGKSANLNNCLQNVIYKEYLGKVDTIPTSEVVVVFDADMNAKPEFFLKVLEVMYDDEISLTLTPQAFSNINPNVDIFNNINQQFWEYVLPGSDAWGYIACTGEHCCPGRCGWPASSATLCHVALPRTMLSPRYAQPSLPQLCCAPSRR